MKKYFKISIPKPCHEDWNEMTQKEKGRFCSSCSKTVIDFTQMNLESIQDYLHENQGKTVCGHIKQTQLDTINLQIPIQTFQRKMSFQRMFILSLLMVMGTSILSCTGQNGKTKKIETIEVVDSIKTKVYDTLHIKQLDSTQNTTIIDNTIEGEMIIGELPIEPVEVMGGISFTDSNNEPIAFSIVDELPQFPNTPTNLSKKEEMDYFRNRVSNILRENFDLEQFSKLNFKGRQRIYVYFEINKEGQLSNIKTRAPHSEMVKEAEKVIKKLPKFKPGKHYGEIVITKYTLPLSFTLND